VTRPYDIAGARKVLGQVMGDDVAARDFFARHIEGTEPMDYAHLLALAGLVLEPSEREMPWLGVALELAPDGGLRISEDTLTASPAYVAGLDREDVILAIDGRPTRAAADVAAAIESRSPGDSVSVRFRRRDGTEGDTMLVLGRSPTVSIVPVESVGRTLTDAERAFRDAWLSSPTRR
jgi:predicted metalloprotease with PDZ domain